MRPSAQSRTHLALAKDAPQPRPIAPPGFTAEDGTIRRTLPRAFDLPATDDEVHVLLDRYGFATSRGHLDQTIAAHAAGLLPQKRSFTVSTFSSMLIESRFRYTIHQSNLTKSLKIS
jgi:hypothetical protein